MKHILEIGHGGFPIGHGTLEDFLKIVPADTHYHGVDFAPENAHSIEEVQLWMLGFEDTTNIFPERIKKLREEIEKEKAKNITLYESDGKKISFKDSYFTEVHMHHVATQPDVQREDLKALIQEAQRVLKTKGSLIVTGEKRGNLFKADLEGYTTTKKALQEEKFNKIEEFLNELERYSIFHHSIKNLLEVRNQEGEGYFILIGVK